MSSGLAAGAGAGRSEVLDAGLADSPRADRSEISGAGGRTDRSRGSGAGPADGLGADLIAGLGAQVENLTDSLNAAGLVVPGSPACLRPRTWRGARLGAEQTVVAVATTAGTPAKARHQARAACEAGADVVELRLDLLEAARGSGLVCGSSAGQELAARVWPAVREAAGELAPTAVPLLLTVRTAAEGGGLEIDDGAYCALLDSLVEACNDEDATAEVVAAVDVELARGCVSQVAGRAGGPQGAGFQGLQPRDRRDRRGWPTGRWLPNRVLWARSGAGTGRDGWELPVSPVSPLAGLALLVSGRVV